MSEEIEVNGKKYIELSVYSELKELYEKKDVKGVNFNSELYLDPAKVMALGSVSVGSDFFKAKFSLEYFKKAIKLLESVNKDCIDICVAKDNVVCLGAYDDKKKVCSGVVIAPRVDGD